jgi:hypothetical protein
MLLNRAQGNVRRSHIQVAVYLNGYVIKNCLSAIGIAKGIAKGFFQLAGIDI